jgi:2-iminobutanoate/2-iminopropanoate deaminase
MKKIIATDRAPQAIGPYSQAVVHNGVAYLSGQIPLDPVSGELVSGDVALQTEQVLKNLQAVLGACGSSLEKVLKVTVYLKDMNDFARMNEVYGRFFREDPPARAAIQAARLPRDVGVEMDAIAVVGD